jgi:hypothetical protein
MGRWVGCSFQIAPLTSIIKSMEMGRDDNSGRTQQVAATTVALLGWLCVVTLSPGGNIFTRGRRGADKPVRLQCSKCGRTTRYSALPREDDDTAWFCKNRHPRKRRTIV